MTLLSWMILHALYISVTSPRFLEKSFVVPAGIYPDTLVMVNGKYYKLIDSRAWAECPLADYYEIGKLLEVDVCVKPDEDFCATGIGVPLRSGMSIFASKSDDSQIAIRTEDELYYIFRLE